MSDDVLATLQAKLRELDAVNAIGKALTSSLDLREVLATIMQRLGELLSPRHSSLLLVDEQSGWLSFEVTTGEGAERLLGLKLAPSEGIAGWAATQQRSLLVPDVRADPRFADRFDRVSNVQTHSIVAVPLMARGRTLGVIELVNGLVDRPFTSDDVRLCELCGEFAAIAIANARNYQKVQELTIVDEHTSLFNARHLRRVLAQEVDRAVRFGHPLSVVFFDLDLFKSVNDTHGHAAGTALLAEVADLMAGSLRAVDVPVRYGGDEFVVVLPETLDQAAVAVAERLRRAISQYRFLRDRGLGLHVTGSFGVATFPHDASTGEALLKAADEAMYCAKSQGRDRVVSARKRS